MSNPANTPNDTQGRATCQRASAGVFRYRFSISSNWQMAMPSRAAMPNDHSETGWPAAPAPSRNATAVTSTATNPMVRNAVPP